MLRLITLVVVFALGPVLSHTASAQQPANVQRLGYLSSGSAPTPATPNHGFEAFRKALADLGYVEGRNIVIEGRWPEEGRADRLPEAAAALVSLKMDGGLSEASRRAAAYVDKILKGAKPGDLPVETVTRHELIINLKTAREIGVTFPPAMLSNANQVVQ